MVIVELTLIDASTFRANRVAAIKAIRSCTGSSLKEAKELTDELMANNDVKLEIPGSSSSIVLSDFITATEGFGLAIGKDQLAMRIRTIAKAALDENRFDVAKKLIDILVDM